VDVVLGDFGCSNGLREGFYTAFDGGLDAMLYWGPVTSVTFIGVTRDHLRL